jgi:hypothetical protein
MVAAVMAGDAWAGTGFHSTWKAPDAQPGTFQGKKVVAVFMSPDEVLRRGVEGTLAYELTRRGVQGVAAYSIIPTAEIRDEEASKARIASSGAAGVVALRLIGRDTELGGSSAGYWSEPSASGVWGGYWSVGWGGVYDAGYVKVDTVLHVETMVFSLEQNKLVWAGQSKTTNAENLSSMMKDLVGKVAGEMKKAGLVKKGK